MKRISKRAFSLFVVVILTLSTTVSVFANFHDALPLWVTVAGYKYELISRIHNENPGEVNFQISVYVQDGKSVPTGYIGCNARIYNSDGNFIKQSGWDYNPGSVNGKDASYLNAESYKVSSGFYYSKGAAKLFNGLEYEIYDANKTTNFAPGRNAIPPKSEILIQRNENGEVYGSDLFLSEIGVHPDLIRAVGIDGTVGYVRAEDLDDGVSTPTEAIVAMQTKQSILVPLYKSDGETVIGSFLLSV